MVPLQKPTSRPCSLLLKTTDYVEGSHETRRQVARPAHAIPVPLRDLREFSHESALG